MTAVKLCGLKDEAALEAALEAGTDFIGFVFYPPSPRYLSHEAAISFVKKIDGRAKTVALYVDPTDKDLKNVGNFDLIQLHGDESPGRVQAVKTLTGKPVMKALRIASESDLGDMQAYEEVSDWLLFDAKVKGQVGGTGQSFDWNLLCDISLSKPWMLSGGLGAENVKNALAILKPDAVDVSSGVESGPGEKDGQKIKDFIKAVKSND